MVNVTLFIQLFHFWIAYMIMTRILLKPVSDSLIKSQEEQHALEKKVEYTTQVISQKITANKQHWINLQKALQAHQPSLVPPALPPAVRSMPQKTTPPLANELTDLINQASNALVSEITHDK